jgi:xylulokinase
MLGTGVLGSSAGRVKNAASPAPAARNAHPHASGALSSLGLPFDAYDAGTLPARLLVTGAAANFPAVANLAGDVFCTPVFMPTSQLDAAQVAPHRNAPPPGFPARAALGSAFAARWVWARERGAGGRGVFEDEVRRILGKRWVSTNGAPARTNVVGAPQVPVALAPPAGASQPGSGASTPYGRVSLGQSVLVEEDEEEEEEESAAHVPPRGLGFDADLALGGASRMRTTTSSTIGTTSSLVSSSSGASASTGYTMPDAGHGGTSPLPSGAGTPTGTGAPVSTTALVPVTALPTAEAEAQLGFAKVAEADVDAFMSYAALVPEYCRLESMLVKGLV